MTFNIQNRQTATLLIQHGLTALCAVGTVLILGWLLRYSSYGIDFTDESFYLNWISNPFIYDASIYLFGFIYHPLFSLLDGDIASIRQANILVTFGLAWSLAYIFLISLASELKKQRVVLFTISAGLATSSLILFDSWLPTPSYNSLALQALLVSGVGVTIAGKTDWRAGLFGWLLIGVGGWLAFMAKPSTTLALMVSVFIYFKFTRKLSIRRLSLAIGVALVLLLVSAILIDGSILRFVNRLELGIELLGYLGGGHTFGQILRIDGFDLDGWTNLVLVLVLLALLAAIWGLVGKSRVRQFVGLVVSFTFFLLTALLTLGCVRTSVEFGQFRGLSVLGSVLAAMFAGRVLYPNRTRAPMVSSFPALACLFLVMPHVYAFGSNGNYWWAGSSAAFFWLLAGVSFLGSLVRERTSWLPVLPFALATQALTALLLQIGLEHPYRQPQPLRHNDAMVEIGPQKSRLLLSAGYAEYFENAMAVAKKAGFEPGAPMIDLSGQSPGILYALGAESLGQAWIIGGYPGSLKFSSLVLARVACEKMANAWVLLEPDGPRSISANFVSSLGGSFPDDYERVGVWRTAEGAGGYSARRTQELYKPAQPNEILANCRALRVRDSK